MVLALGASILYTDASQSSILWGTTESRIGVLIALEKRDDREVVGVRLP
jgi:hypothetical protein